MRCKKILFGFGHDWFHRQEVDFLRQHLVGRDSLVVAACVSNTPQPAVHSTAGEEALLCGQVAESARAKLTDYLLEAAHQGQFAVQLHTHSGQPLSRLLAESRYSDLLVITQSSCRESQSAAGPMLIGDMLLGCECPVMVLPDRIDGFDQVIITFDGSAKAMHGIKQFLYVLPELATDLPVTVLATYPDTQEPPAASEKLFVEYLKRHFRQIALHRVTAQTESTMVRTVGLNERSLVIVNNQSPRELEALNSLLNPGPGVAAPVEIYTQGLA